MATPPPLPRRFPGSRTQPPPLPTRLVPPNIPFRVGLTGRRGDPGEKWWAQDKDVAVGDDRELSAPDRQQLGVKDRISQRIQRGGGLELHWVPGPPASHVHSFALWYAPLLMTKRMPSGEWVVDSPADLPPSRIYVRFRPTKAGTHKTKRKGIRRHKARFITQYVYYSPRHEWMKSVYQRILASPHPGRVIFDYLVDEVPYQRIY